MLGARKTWAVEEKPDSKCKEPEASLREVTPTSGQEVISENSTLLNVDSKQKVPLVRSRHSNASHAVAGAPHFPLSFLMGITYDRIHQHSQVRRAKSDSSAMH